MTNKEFKGFVRLSSDQYAELKLNGSLVIEGRTIEYSPLDTIYMITDAGNMIDVANTTEGKQNDVVLNITNNILRAQLNQTIKTKINNKQDKLTAGTNITIDTNNVISASGGLTKVVATDVDSKSATNGQVLTADGSGGASWQNAGGGGKWYRHHILCYSTVGNRFYIDISIITNNSTVIGTFQLLLDMLEQNGFTNGHKCPVVSHTFFDMKGDVTSAIATGISKSSGTQIEVFGFSMGIDNNVVTASNATKFYTSFTSISDTVTEL